MPRRDKAIAQQLQEMRANFAAGKRDEFLRAIILCLSFDQPLPTWASDHLLSGALMYTQARARTLDEALGLKRAKSWRLASSPKQQRFRNLAVAAFVMVRALVDHGLKVEVAIEEVASKLDLSEATVKRSYYDRSLRKSLGYSQSSRKSEPDG
ncbi:MAG: hypothetical protein ACTHJG_02065 [Rhodanobacteraceae bacterium]